MTTSSKSYIDADDVRRTLADEVAKFPSQALWCAKHGVSTAYLSDVLNKRRDPGKKILDALGLEAVTLYRNKTVSK